MLRVEVVNLSSFSAAMAEKYPQAVKRGTGEGVHQFADVVATDLRQTAPIKSGRLRNSIRSRIIDPMTSAVGYNTKEAWYAPFVDLGTKAHPIYPKGRRGSRETKRISSRYRRHGGQTVFRGGVDWSQETRAAWSGLTGGGHQTMRANRAVPGGIIGSKATALTIGGKLYSSVMHPGIRPRHMLASRLEATKSKAPAILDAAIQLEIQKERG